MEEETTVQQRWILAIKSYNSQSSFGSDPADPRDHPSRSLLPSPFCLLFSSDLPVFVCNSSWIYLPHSVWTTLGAAFAAMRFDGILASERATQVTHAIASSLNFTGGAMSWFSALFTSSACIFIDSYLQIEQSWSAWTLLESRVLSLEF